MGYYATQNVARSDNPDYACAFKKALWRTVEFGRRR